MKLLEKIIDKIDDSLNPIVVKELRQAVQSRFVVSLLMLLLVALMSVMGFFTLFSMSENTTTTTTMITLDKGRHAFGILFGIFVFSSMFFVPLYTAFRMFTERSGDNMDLVFISAVKPGAIIRGKLFAGMAITLLLFSVCLPFMCFTYLLRGVDLPSIFVILAMAFIAVAIVTQVALFVSCERWNRMLRAIMGLGLAGIVIISCFTTIAVANDMLQAGVGSRLGSWDFWRDTVFILIPTGLLTGLVYMISVAEITPSSANRAFGIRLYVTFSWLLTGIISFTNVFYFKKSGIQEWFVFFLYIMGVALMVAVCERDGQSPRVVHAIPYGKIKRAAAFFFYSGAANGVAWALVMTGLTFFAFIFGQVFYHPISGWNASDFLYTSAGFFLYHYCLTVSGLLIRKKLLWKLVQPKNTWIVIIWLYAVSVIIPIIIAIWRGTQKLPPGMLLVGFINYIAAGGDKPDLTIPGIWAAVVTVLSLPWFIKQAIRFAPPGNSNPGL